jgi:hypothetical protein
VIISHGASLDIPGRVAVTGNAQYRLREVFAYAEPFSADGFHTVVWTKQSGDVAEVTLETGVRTDVAYNNTNNWWHSYDYITLRGHAPGSTVVLRATAKDENANPKPYADITVNVKKPLYLKIPYNVGNDTGAIAGQTLARQMYSPYHFNLDMNIKLEITKHDLDTVKGPINVAVWDRNNELAAPFITFQVSGLGTHTLHIPANTLPREEYYKIVARSANGDALGYEWFRVDGYSAINWDKTVYESGNNVNIRFNKMNSNVSGTITLAADAAAYVNGVKLPVSVGTASTGANSNMHTLIIAGGIAEIAAGNNDIEVVGVKFAQYPDQTFTITESYKK